MDRALSDGPSRGGGGDRACHICGKTGHIKRDCPEGGGGGGGGGGRNAKSSSSSTKRPRDEPKSATELDDDMDSYFNPKPAAGDGADGDAAGAEEAGKDGDTPVTEDTGAAAAAEDSGEETQAEKKQNTAE